MFLFNFPNVFIFMKTNIFFYFVFIGFIICNKTIAQSKHPLIPYEQLKFRNLVPLWYETSIFKNMIGDSCDGYNFLRYNYQSIPIIDGNFIYQNFILKGIKDIALGSVIEKRSLSDGKLIWQAFYNLTNNDRQEAPKRIFINENGNIEIIGLKRIAKYGMADPSFLAAGSDKMKMTRRIYDSQSGNLIYNYQPDLNDANIVNLFYGYEHLRKSSSRLDIIDNKIIYRETYSFGPPTYDFRCLQFELDTLGSRVSKIDTFIPLQVQSSHNIERLNDSTLMKISGIDNTEEIFIQYLDKNFKETEKKLVESCGFVNNFELLKANKDRFLGCNRVPLSFRSTYEFVLYSTTGKLLKKAMLDDLGNYAHNFATLYWEEGNDIFLVGSASTNDENGNYVNAIDILKSNDNGGFDIVKRITLVDVIRATAVVDVQRLSNGDFLLYLYETSWEIYPFLFDGESVAHSIMRVKESELGLSFSTGTNTIVEKKNAASLSPNPANNFIEFRFQDNFIGDIEIINSYGQAVRKIQKLNSNFISLDISSLSSGIYFARYISEESKIETSKFFKL
jgi:hypothetical protein